MYEVQEWAEVHRLFHREDLSKAAIARRMGMSRNTVARLLGLSEPPKYERSPLGSKLDPHKATIVGWLREDADVAATVVLERLRDHGYGGGITILKDWLAQVRPLFREPRQRTSYLPGEIGQLDWWEPGLEVPVGKDTRREAFGMVCSLPHSAAHAAVFAFGKTRADAAPALVSCLRRLGGVPAGLVVDRDTSLVVPKSRPPRLHPELAAVFGSLRTRPIILRPRTPESKGQVERTIGYLERSFLPLRRFDSLGDLQAQHDQWADQVAYRRHHRRVGAVVGDAWAVERGFLGPLPDPLPDTDQRLEVRAARDGFVRVGGADYSVPPGYGGRRLQVRVSVTEVAVWCDGRPLARHVRSFVPADVVLDPAHARALRLHREANRRLNGAAVEVPAVDLGRYDQLVEASS